MDQAGTTTRLNFLAARTGSFPTSSDACSRIALGARSWHLDSQDSKFRASQRVKTGNLRQGGWGFWSQLLGIGMEHRGDWLQAPSDFPQGGVGGHLQTAKSHPRQTVCSAGCVDIRQCVEPKTLLVFWGLAGMGGTDVTKPISSDLSACPVGLSELPVLDLGTSEGNSSKKHQRWRVRIIREAAELHGTSCPPPPHPRPLLAMANQEAHNLRA